MVKKEILGGGTGTILAAAAAFLLLKDVSGQLQKDLQKDYTKMTADEIRVDCFRDGDVQACKELELRGIGTTEPNEKEIDYWSEHSNAELEDICFQGGDQSACDELQRRRKWHVSDTDAKKRYRAYLEKRYRDAQESGVPLSGDELKQIKELGIWPRWLTHRGDTVHPDAYLPPEADELEDIRLQQEPTGVEKYYEGVSDVELLRMWKEEGNQTAKSALTYRQIRRELYSRISTERLLKEGRD